MALLALYTLVHLCVFMTAIISTPVHHLAKIPLDPVFEPLLVIRGDSLTDLPAELSVYICQN